MDELEWLGSKSVRKGYTKWTDRMAFDVALKLEGSGESISNICETHKITSDDLRSFNSDKIFLKKVEGYREDIRDKGMTFRIKARMQAEELLMTSWSLIHHGEVSPAVKADLIKSTVKWAGLEPKGDISVGGPSGGVQIMINLGEQTKGRACESRREKREKRSRLSGDRGLEDSLIEVLEG